MNKHSIMSKMMIVTMSSIPSLPLVAFHFWVKQRTQAWPCWCHCNIVICRHPWVLDCQGSRAGFYIVFHNFANIVVNTWNLQACSNRLTHSLYTWIYSTCCSFFILCNARSGCWPVIANKKVHQTEFWNLFSLNVDLFVLWDYVEISWKWSGIWRACSCIWLTNSCIWMTCWPVCVMRLCGPILVSKFWFWKW